MANIGETARLLFGALDELNHLDIPSQQRLKALELLHKPVLYVTDRMKRHFVDQTLPLARKNLKIAHLSREMSHSLATGYKILVSEQAGGGGRGDSKLLATAIHRALKQLGLVLLKTYQVYEPFPGTVWQEVHTLYRFAENRNLHQVAVVRGEQGASTISEAYRQILLLALACPYRLRHGEAEAVYAALEEWAPLSELQPLDEHRKALFSTDLDSNQPPRYLSMRGAGEDHGTLRALQTRRLAEQVRDTLSGKAETGPGASLRPATLRRLMLAWGVMPKRRFSRVKDHDQVVVAMGLSSIHYFVSGEVAFNNASIDLDCYKGLGATSSPQLQEPAHYRSRPTRQDSARAPDMWEMSYRIEGERDPSPTEVAVARAAAGLRIDTSHCAQNWKMVNVSAGGYCMLWDNAETTRAQVGELLGIREERDPDTFHWRLGVVRWLRYEVRRGLELGVQMLSPGAVAIAARRDSGSDSEPDDRKYTRGLLLPEIASIQQRASLVLPSPPFKVGDTAVANCHGKDVRVRLTEMVENTGSFAQFQFESLGEIPAAGQARHKTAPDNGEFDDIWELL
jgi:hypothetical protein